MDAFFVKKEREKKSLASQKIDTIIVFVLGEHRVKVSLNKMVLFV